MAYAPAVNTYADRAGNSLDHVAVTFYKKSGLDRLEKNFRHGMLGEPDSLPLRSGQTVQWFRYNNLASNTSAATEGAVGTSVTIASDTISASVSQYADFANFSDLLVETAIDPMVTNGSELMGYRLGLSVDTLIRTEIESVNSSVDEDTVGSYFSASDLRKARSLLQAADVQPMEGGYFRALCSPYVTYDLVNDPTAGGFTDLTKWIEPSRTQEAADRGLIGRIGGVELWESTNVATSGSAPNTKYHVTVAGRGALGVVDLAGRGVTGFAMMNTPPSQMPINVIPGELSIANPMGTVGAAVSYNVKFVAKLLRTGSDDYRFRIFEADSSIAS